MKVRDTGDLHPHGHQVGLIEKQMKIPGTQGGVKDRQHNGDHIADPLADGAVHLGQIRPLFSQAPAAEGHRRHLHPVSKEKERLMTFIPTWWAAKASVPSFATMMETVRKPIRMKICSTNTLEATLNMFFAGSRVTRTFP